MPAREPAGWAITDQLLVRKLALGTDKAFIRIILHGFFRFLASLGTGEAFIDLFSIASSRFRYSIELFENSSK